MKVELDFLLSQHTENCRQVNYLLLKEKYRCLLRRPIKRLVKLTIKLVSYLSFASAVFYRPLVNTISELLFNLFRKELRQVNRSLDSFEAKGDRSGGANKDDQSSPGRGDGQKDHPTSSHLTGDTLDDEMRQNDNAFKSKSNLKTENRCYLVVDQAHVLVAEFCVQSLRAITGTLFHFWVIQVFAISFF